MGYSIGCRQCSRDGELHVSVRIHQESYRELKDRFERNAVHRSVDDLCRDLRSIPFEPYAPVRDQIRCILRAVNRRRAAGGFETVPRTLLRETRRPVRPFDQSRE